MAPTTGRPHTASPCEVKRVPILYDKRPPRQQPLRLLTSRLPMTLQCPTWLGRMGAFSHSARTARAQRQLLRCLPR